MKSFASQFITKEITRGRKQEINKRERGEKKEEERKSIKTNCKSL
jgi:hypothetical protein